jgi:uncharacterized protein
VLRSQHGLRLLGANDLPEVLALLATDPVPNVFVDYRARLTRLEPRWLGGEAWGWFRDGRLTSLCHAAANLVPVLADEEALRAFAARAMRKGRVCSTIVGPQEQVEVLWSALETRWDTPREMRRTQPHLEASGPPEVEPDPLVRRSERGDVEALYPACVAMYTEEVGVSPLVDDGGRGYKRRITELVRAKRAYARFVGRRVVFKAELAIVTRRTTQVQGVWVDPEFRGRGLAAAAMAAVTRDALHRVAPTVSLYVNDYNTPARRVYAQCGFAQAGAFATVLF